MFSPAILGAILGAVALVAFGAGFALESWRTGAQIEKLKGENTLLTSFNDNCAADVQNVKTAMAALMQATDEIEIQAAEMMKKAEPQVKKRTATITRIKALPSVPVDMQCEAIKEEQKEYVQARK